MASTSAEWINKKNDREKYLFLAQFGIYEKN